MATTGYMMTAFFYGLGIGFVNSIPIGPVNVSIIDTSFRKGFWHAFSIGLGALIIDILYCAVAVFGVSLVEKYFLVIFQPLGLPVLTILGLRLIYKGRKQTSAEPAIISHKEITKHFSLGFLIYLANPLAIGFWVVVCGFIFSYELIRQNATDEFSFVVGMAIGTALWFFLLAKIIAWKKRDISEIAVRRISIGTGFVLILSGLYLGYTYLKTFL